MTPSAQRICTQCGEPRPISEYLPDQGRCQSCRAARAKAFREKKRASSSEPKQKPGPKPKSVAPPAPAPALPVVDSSEARAALDNRGSLEAEIKQRMASTAAYYDKLIAHYEAQYTAAAEEGLINEMAKATAGMRATVKDADASNQRIVKQFSLMAELSRPMDTDPKFAPIRFVLNAAPPADAIVEKKFHILPEDVQGAQPEAD